MEKNNNKIIFIDFDDVLFHSAQFIQDEKNIFWKYGISETLFRKYYYQYVKDDEKGKVRRYDLNKQIQGIKKELNIDEEKLKKELIKLLSDTRRYIFEDGLLFVKKFQQQALYIVSFSQTDFQRKKIKNSGLAEYFQEIVITDGNKGMVLNKILQKRENKNKEAYFIDDKNQHISEIKSKLPIVNTILMKRVEGRYQNESSKNCDYTVKNFEEVNKILIL